MDNHERPEQIEEEMNPLKLLIDEQQEMIEKLKRSWFNLRMNITNVTYLE